MSLVRWIRKNNRKIMVFVVIFCMVSFVIGFTGLQIISNIFSPHKETVARYGDDEKIRRLDLANAQNELAVLRLLRSEQLLASQGLSGALLSYLLFPDSQIAGDIAAQLKQAVQRGQLQISLDDLEAYFNQPTRRPEELWILLRAEAYRAGFIVSDEEATQILRQVIPQLMQVDATVVVQQIISRHNLPEDRIIRVFGDLLTIIYYANVVMDNEAVTLDQIKAYLGRTEERFDAEYVEIDAASFIAPDTAVSDDAIREQFETCKDNVPHTPTEDNPFGFGYRLPKRVQVEYMVLLMEDVRAQIEPPTPEEMEEYYSSNIERFQRQIPSDPNDPQSEKIIQTRSFAEVVPQIRAAIKNEKATSLANMMFNDIKSRTETGFEKITFEEATVEQLQMAAGDYQAAARDVSAEYNVPLRTGKTGWLSPAALVEDNVLGSLSLQQQQLRVPLPELLLAVTRDPSQEAQRRIGMPIIRVWQNIGPIRGGFFSTEKEEYVQLMTMVRVVGIRPAGIPESLDIEYDTTDVVIVDEPEQGESVFSLREQVKEDVLLKRAMDTAGQRAAELAEMAGNQGWDKAVAAYNEKYAPGWDPNEPQENTAAVELQPVKQQMRASQAEISFAQQYIRENPTAAEFMQQSLIMNALNNRLYEMLPDDAESTGTIHKVLVFEPQAACYVVKNVTRQPPTIADYLDNKASAAIQLNQEDMTAAALVHFDPGNILDRMNYQPVEPKQVPVETAEEEAVTEEE